LHGNEKKKMIIPYLERRNKIKNYSKRKGMENIKVKAKPNIKKHHHD
jgi:hypothetical protein